MAVLTLTKENFEQEVKNSNVPVLVDFWAPWCGPCKMVGPIIEEAAQEVTNGKIGKVNVDEQPELAQSFNIMSIPTLMVFKDGEVISTSVGVKSKEAMIEMLNK
jgi:thioredoxin 1